MHEQVSRLFLVLVGTPQSVYRNKPIFLGYYMSLLDKFSCIIFVCLCYSQVKSS
jgi:hypothetical protein